MKESAKPDFLVLAGMSPGEAEVLLFRGGPSQRLIYLLLVQHPHILLSSLEEIFNFGLHFR